MPLDVNLGHFFVNLLSGSLFWMVSYNKQFNTFTTNKPLLRWQTKIPKPQNTTYKKY